MPMITIFEEIDFYPLDCLNSFGPLYSFYREICFAFISVKSQIMLSRVYHVAILEISDMTRCFL